MSQTHACSGEVVSVRPLGEALAASRTTAVLKAEQLEIVRLVLHAGQVLREHAAPGEITILGLEGRIALGLDAGDVEIGPGDFIHLQAGAPHALRALQDSSVLLTICLAARQA